MKKYIESLRSHGVPKKTHEDTKYCLNLWCAYRKEANNDIYSHSHQTRAKIVAGKIHFRGENSVTLAIANNTAKEIYV